MITKDKHILLIHVIFHVFILRYKKKSYLCTAVKQNGM